MLEIIQAETEEYKSDIRELFWEYFNWSNLTVSSEFDISFDVNSFLEQDLTKLQQFSPPSGRLLLAKYQAHIAGCACLRKIGEDVGEIKRMYIKPEYRRKGIGRSLLQAIIYEAEQIGYAKIRLDSAPFAKVAQALYRSLGFLDISPYAESEIPEKYRPYWIFMELIIQS